MSTSDTPTRGARRAFYPGSFDPFHLGHLDVVEQGVGLFGEVVVGVLYNFAKDTGTLSVDHRVALIESVTGHLGGVTVAKHTGLAIHAAAESGADVIVKGLRNASDFDIEQQMAQMNHSVSGIRTVYVPTSPELGFVSSRFVREIAKYGGNVDHLVPGAVAEALRSTFGDGQRS